MLLPRSWLPTCPTSTLARCLRLRCAGSSRASSELATRVLAQMVFPTLLGALVPGHRLLSCIHALAGGALPEEWNFFMAAFVAKNAVEHTAVGVKIHVSDTRPLGFNNCSN